MLAKEVKRALEYQAVVALIGPRQVGKTTLAQKIAQEYKAFYLDLEDQNDHYPVSGGVEAIGLYEMAQELRNLH